MELCVAKMLLIFCVWILMIEVCLFIFSFVYEMIVAARQLDYSESVVLQMLLVLGTSCSGLQLYPCQIFDTSWNKGATIEKRTRRAAILTLRRCSVQTGGRRDPKLGVQKVLWIPYRSHLVKWMDPFWVPSRQKSPFALKRKSETSKLTTLPKKIRKDEPFEGFFWEQHTYLHSFI